jgi:hypothetical protein
MSGLRTHCNNPRRRLSEQVPHARPIH